MKTALVPCPYAEICNRGDCCGECFNDPERVVKAIRDIMTDWNFGPLPDREALERIHAFVGDHVQNGVAA